MSGQRFLTAVAVVAGLCLAASCGKKGSKKKEKDPAPAPAMDTPAGMTMGAGMGPTKPPPRPPQPRPKAKPRITKAQAQALLTRAAAEGKKRKPKCGHIMKAVNMAAALVGPTTPTNKRAFLLAAMCGERLKNYRMMLWAASALAKADPKTLKLGIIARAWMHLNKPKRSLAVLRAIDKKYPGAPGVLFAAMLLADNQKKWKVLIKMAEKTTKALLKSRFKGMAWQAQLMLAKAWIFKAKMKKVEKAIARAAKVGAPPAYLKQVRKRLIPVKATKMYINPDVPKKIYLGTFHLYGKAKVVGELFTIEIANLTGKDQSMKLEVEIPGVTDRVTKTVNILKGGHETVALTPPLKTGFNPKQLQAERKAQLNVKVTLSASKKVVYEESIETKLFPRDQLPLRHNRFIPAWITPQAPEVEKLLTAAKQRAPGKKLAGSLGPTLPQMKALYDELKARGMSYVLVTNFGLSHAQHARLPADTIKSTNALCLDGALLFATLAEKLGLRPVLVRVPGHIFFGWHAEKADRAKPGTIFFLETTMVGTHGFKAAMRAGVYQFLRQKKLKGFKTRQAQLIDIIRLRKAGITPQPWG